MINANERIDDLQMMGLRIIQQRDGFCFGVDAVLLANFVTAKEGMLGADFGTGTGIIPILVAGKSKVAHITALEIQEEVAEMANRSVELNQLSQRISIVADNLKNAHEYIEPGSLDFITSNPPYMDGKGLTNTNEKKKISRHEIYCNLEDLFYMAGKLLKYNGAFFMIHRPARLCDVIETARKYKMEPKLLRFVHPKPSKAPNLMLIKFVRSGKPELRILDPLYIYNEDGTYSDDVHHMYTSQRLCECHV